jgi:protein-L-isoaspartate(D-aspartate) O-methyltransferase
MDYVRARTTMVDSQLRTNRIGDPAVLKAMSDVPRERFLPKALHGVAYSDEDIQLAGGRFLIEPLALARLLQTAAPKPQDIALVIGCGTGYAATILSKLAATVISIQPDIAAAARLQPLLDSLEADNVVLTVAADPTAGDPSQAPFDVILLVGSVDGVPDSLLQQLGEGGRLTAVIHDGRLGKGTAYTRVHGVIGARTLFDAQISHLPGFSKPPVFAF